MIGGILLPGDAETGDVVSGKTFSSGDAGLGATGTLALPIGTVLGPPYMSSVTSQVSSYTISVGKVFFTNDVLLLAAWGVGSTSPTISSVTGAGASWSRIRNLSSTDLTTELWIGKTPTVSSSAQTVTINMSEACDCAGAIIDTAGGIVGTEVANNTATGTSTGPIVASVTAVDNSCVSIVTAGWSATGSFDTGYFNGNPTFNASSGLIVPLGPTIGQASAFLFHYPAAISGTYDPTWYLQVSQYWAIQASVIQ